MQAPSLNPNLKDFWLTTKTPEGDNVTGRVLYGGRMSSKSHDMAGVAIARANFIPQRLLCTRMYQNRISDSVYTLLSDKISYFNLSHKFKVYADAIEHKTNGSLFRFYGIARNVDEIKSFEGANVWWNEESHNLKEEAFKTIRPTIMRNEGAEMWFSLNPQLASDYSYQRLIVSPPRGFLVRQINYPDNPFLLPSALADIEKEFEEDPEEAGHIYLGIPRTDDDNAIIKRSWIEAAVDAHLALTDINMTGARVVGYDVADSGDDKNAVVAFDGAICVEIDEWKAPEDELTKSALRAWSFVKNGIMLYDSIGVGAHTGSTLKEAGKERDKYYKFNAGGAVINQELEYAAGIKNGEKFENLKAQAWQDVSDRFRNTYNAINKGMVYPASELISLSSSLDHLDKLKTELSTPRRSYSKRGLDMLETKEQLSKRGVKSPNIGDAFIMSACPHLITRAGGLWG